MAEDWLTSFYWQQDLRSYYMNNILNATVRPGIYNANIGIVAYSNTSGNQVSEFDNGLNLFIKKGTTLIFSDSYVNSNNRMERDLSSVGSYLIKSVALGDIKVQVVTRNRVNFNKILGNANDGSEEPDRFLIVARLMYSQNSAISGGYNTPQFYGFTYKSTGELDPIGEIDLPEGSGITPSSNGNIAYLILGEVSLKGDNRIYANSTEWNSSSNGISAYSIWNKSHVFFGRGFPDYRYSMPSTTEDMNSEVLLDIRNDGADTSISKLKVDLKPSLLNGKIVSSETNWKGVYGLNSYVSGNNISIKKYENADLISYNDSSKRYVITDLIYMTDNLKLSGETSDNEIRSLYSSSSDKSPMFKTYSWVGEIDTSSFSLLNPKGNIKEYVTRSLNSTSANDTLENALSEMIPLDVSSINQNRLVSFIKNKDLLGPIINRIRQEGDTSSNARIDTIVPVALVFRGFQYKNDAVEFADTISDGSNYNPANVLSFFDLQYGSHKLNTLNANIDNVYTVLPVVE